MDERDERVQLTSGFYNGESKDQALPKVAEIIQCYDQLVNFGAKSIQLESDYQYKVLPQQKTKSLPDFAIVKAYKGDRLGNLVFRKTTRNFSVPMAKAGNITIAEVEELVEPGELDPNFIHTPGIYVHRIFQGQNYEKRIEQRTVRKRE